METRSSLCFSDRESPADDVLLMRDVRKLREKGGVNFEIQIPFLSIARGEFVAVVGPSGCGKSTLLDMLALVLKPTDVNTFTFRPSVQDVAMDVTGLSDKKAAAIRKRYIGYVLQTGGLLPFLTVQENILLPCQLNGISQNNTIQNLVARLGIEDQLLKKPQHLSGGQRQRVAIARALAFNPLFVLADEPTAAVDKLTAIEIMNEFKELTSMMGVTLVMVTHNETLLTNAVDRTITFSIEKKNQYHTVSTVYEPCQDDNKESI